MRLIDADRLDYTVPENPHYLTSVLVQLLKNAIDKCPTVDAVPVVRCKDCKQKGWVQEPCHGKSVDYCKVWDCTLRNLETTFCSYGERKEESGA